MSQVAIDEIKKHSSVEDCWLVVDGNVWDMTDFAPNHPGGSAIIHRFAGRDASETYNAIHAPSILFDNLGEEKLKGTLNAAEAAEGAEWLKPPVVEKKAPRVGVKPPLQSLISSYDFEEVASKTLSAKTWAFYSSAATDLITMNANKAMFDRIWWRPRVMRDVSEADTRTTILGYKVDVPFFVSPAAMARMVHPEGEKAMARGCANAGVGQCVSRKLGLKQSIR